jgi:hypothetical protein
MIRIKSLRPCRLIVTDVGLKFNPGQVISVESLSPQTQDMIEKGYLVRLDLKPPPATASKAGDTLHLDGQIDKTGILVKINARPVRVTTRAFEILLKLVVCLKSDHSGWVYGSELAGVNYHIAIMRLRKQITPSLKTPAAEFIENNGHGAYRISTHPDNVSFDAAKIKALHSELHIHALLDSVGKAPSGLQ